MEEKVKELLDKLDDRVSKASGALKTEIEGLIDEVKSANTDNVETIKGLEKRVSEIEVKAAKDSKSISEKTGTVSFADAVRKGIEENLEKIKAVATGENQNGVKFELKAVGNITSANITAGDIPQAERFAGFDVVPSRRVRLLNLLSARSTDADKVEWVYQAGKEGTAGQTAEGAAKNQIDFDWTVGSEVVKKSTAYIKVTDEMLAKGAIVSQEINNELVREVLKVVESQVYSGDATGSNLRGLRTVASAFSAATTDVAVVNANIIDVLAVAMTQIMIAQEGEAMPNYILMHPRDVLKLKLEKLSASDKRYVGRLLDAGSGLSVDGVPIVETTLVTAGTYLIGDFNFAELVQREGMRIEIGYDSDDFTKNFRTIRCEWRGALVVRNNKRSAFVAGTFATDIAALEAIV